MAQLLLKDQENYVPCEGGDPKNILETIVFDGDALTEERARNVQWTFKDGDCPFDRLEGLDPSHADWHAKVKLYEVQYPLVLINLYPLLPGGVLPNILVLKTLTLFQTKIYDFSYPFSDLTPKIYTPFQTCQIKKAKTIPYFRLKRQKPYPISDQTA